MGTAVLGEGAGQFHHIQIKCNQIKFWSKFISGDPQPKAAFVSVMVTFKYLFLDGFPNVNKAPNLQQVHLYFSGNLCSNRIPKCP